MIRLLVLYSADRAAVEYGARVCLHNPNLMKVLFALTLLYWFNQAMNVHMSALLWWHVQI